ncbi:unnamed protein product [Rotaria socialis]|uniref:Uncharacterized protein n=2 Tax=Rotaria socialis TaxID=392032 RepID=A0A820BNJ1_9BILA|nr:unnamed protein product [Rotaria socialis]CAF4356385.1 unnamed protein product [Rotaria socialis]CAF4516653.1 unnamed protein product [Rotaria socialis]CAF4755819.1 unnamed protein product [Rotaria socialis]CAF4757538.1 unnamed protein product [Rotaria socialis]
MAIIEANNITTVINVLRTHLDVLWAHQQIKYPQHNYITWPMVLKLVQDVNQYYTCGILDVDDVASTVAGVGGGNYQEQLQRSEQHMLDLLAKVDPVKNAILTHLDIRREFYNH